MRDIVLQRMNDLPTSGYLYLNALELQDKDLIGIKLHGSTRIILFR
jgi:hypothetical protein